MVRRCWPVCPGAVAIVVPAWRMTLGYTGYIWETGDSVKSQHFKVVSPFAHGPRDLHYQRSLLAIELEDPSLSLSKVCGEARCGLEEQSQGADGSQEEGCLVALAASELLQFWHVCGGVLG